MEGYFKISFIIVEVDNLVTKARIILNYLL
jgi:hypothetical protein